MDKDREYKKVKDYSYSRIYMKWNYTTACCFRHKTKCDLCPNEIVCEEYKKEDEIHPIKYATLMTYRNIGLKGMRDYDARNE